MPEWAIGALGTLAALGIPGFIAYLRFRERTEVKAQAHEEWKRNLGEELKEMRSDIKSLSILPEQVRTLANRLRIFTCGKTVCFRPSSRSNTKTS